MPLYGHVYLINICKLSIICINSESRHVIVTLILLVGGGRLFKFVLVSVSCSCSDFRLQTSQLFYLNGIQCAHQ